MTPVLNLLLSHQPAAAVEKMLAYWSDCVPTESILLACGGPKEEFDAIRHKQKFYVDDPRLRTRDHQREFQSYTQLYHEAVEFLKTEDRELQCIHFAEYDHLPHV
jgi:hypothetical protein